MLSSIGKDEWITAESVFGLGVLYFRVGQIERSVQVMAFMQGFPPVKRLDISTKINDYLTNARRVLSATAFDTARSVGEAWTLKGMCTALEAAPKLDVPPISKNDDQ